MPVAFPNAALVQGESEVEFFEKDVALVDNANAGLRLGTDAAMSHSSPFFLMLLYFLQTCHKSKDGALRYVFALFQ